MPEPPADVPPDIENYLIALSARAGQIGGATGGVAGGAIGGPGAGGAAGGRGGARGGAWAAARLKTKVEQRSGQVPGTADEVTSRLRAAFPKATALPAGDHLRLAVPLGLAGLQQIVLDVEFAAASESGLHVVLRGYGKEGLINRKPTRTVSDQAWAAVVTGAS